MRSSSPTSTKVSAAEREAPGHAQEEVKLAEPRVEGQERPERIEEPLRLVHHHPGYLRIRADAFLRPEDGSPVVAAARTAAESASGFHSWNLNPKTGSVVIEYDPGALDADDLLKHIAKSAGFHGVEIATRRKVNRQEVVSSFLNGVEDVNQVFRQLTGGRSDLRELTPVALAVVSAVSFALGENRGRWPEWSGALYHSYRVFMHWHRREVRTREREGRQEEERAGSGAADSL